MRELPSQAELLDSKDTLAAMKAQLDTLAAMKSKIEVCMYVRTVVKEKYPWVLCDEDGRTGRLLTNTEHLVVVP